MPIDQKNREQVAFERIREEIRVHLDGSDAPEEIRSFLLDDWSRLMTMIFFGKGNQHPDWQAGWDTVNTLLWSLSPKQGREDTLQMLQLVPPMLARLQEGCTALNLDIQACDRLFTQLAMLHAAVTRVGLQSGLADIHAGQGLKQAVGRPVAGMQVPRLGPDSTQRRPLSRIGKNAPAALPGLAVGDRVRFRFPDGEKILLLNWVSPQQGMYLFANEQGLDSLSLTRARLVAKFARGEASRVS
jgi:hypothetical protein